VKPSSQTVDGLLFYDFWGRAGQKGEIQSSLAVEDGKTFVEPGALGDIAGNTIMAVRRKCFISYHHADEDTVANFVNTFDHAHDVFIRRRLGELPEDIINSTNPDYVMARIRELYIKDTSVTIVMLGQCTWARRYVDWEIQTSLRQSDQYLPNGLLGIKLSTFSQFPDRFNSNLTAPGEPPDRNYAGHIEYPANIQALENAIEWAFNRRTTHKQYIKNPRERFTYNRTCP
jgi:hypothetical protein